MSFNEWINQCISKHPNSRFVTGILWLVKVHWIEWHAALVERSCSLTSSATFLPCCRIVSLLKIVCQNVACYNLIVNSCYKYNAKVYSDIICGLFVIQLKQIGSVVMLVWWPYLHVGKVATHKWRKSCQTSWRRYCLIFRILWDDLSY